MSLSSQEYRKEPEPINIVGTALGFGAAVIVGAGLFLATRYKVSKPEQFLVRTGLGIKDMSISRTGIVFPFQDYSFISMHPATYQFNLHNMSREKVEFNLPVVFTISPAHPLEDPEAFKRYAQMMNDLPPEDVEQIVRGVVEGETRGLTANLTVEEMFNSKEKFKSEVVNKIEIDLQKLGLRVLNANIKEMSDYDEHNKYFTYRKQRAIESANYDAQVEVAEARKTGEIGLKQKEKDSRVKIAQLDTEAIVSENERAAEIAQSNAQLEEVRAQSRKRSEIANLDATMAAKLREAELQSQVEVKRQAQLLEQLRADELVNTKVQAEQAIAEAEGKAASIRHLADAHLYEEQKKAEAIQAELSAHSAGLKAIVDACDGDSATVKFYLGLKDGIYEKLAHQQAQAVSGMKPQISVWNTGSNANSDPISPILKTVQSMAPMLDGLHKHTDFEVPEWLIKKKSNNTEIVKE
mmetsp:Transcript_11217/g.19175  ORF Transcript_11217/g.19175 Transcript_11217/m.19175 type:complete len:466 (-) Transcript_11217:57-1454(-)